MLPKHYTNEWLNPRATSEHIAYFLNSQFDRALIEQIEEYHDSELSLGLRMHNIMNALCVGLTLRGLIDDHAIFWDDDGHMSLSFIRQEGETPYTLDFYYGKCEDLDFS